MTTETKRLLVVRFDLSQQSYGCDRYAHVNAFQARANENDERDYDVLYSYEHPTHAFRFSMQGSPAGTNNSTPLWYAHRIGFSADHSDTVDTEYAERALKGCKPIVRKIRAALEAMHADGVANANQQIGLIATVAAKALGVDGVLLIDRTNGETKSYRYSVKECGRPISVVADRALQATKPK